MFSLSSLHHVVRSLLAINITFTAIGILSGYYRIHISNLVNGLEISVYTNLIIFSVTATHVNTPEVLVSLLVGIVLAIMIAITVYHFHLAYIKKSPMWLRMKVKVSNFKEAVLKQEVNRGTPEQSLP